MVSPAHRHDVAALATIEVSNTLTIRYHIRKKVQNTLTIRYHIRKKVQNTLKCIYHIRKKVSNTLTIRYHIRKNISNTLTVIYNVVGGTGWAPFVPASKHPDDKPKHKVITRYQTQITAKLTADLTHEFGLVGRLKDLYTGNISASTDKFYKVNKTGQLEGRLREPLLRTIPVEGKLSFEVRTGVLRSRLSFRHLLEMIHENIRILLGEIEEFYFDEQIESAIDNDSAPQFTAFTHSSSFVGNVRYDRANQEMWIILNGKRYHYCNVPERIFDGFAGANSKGEYYNRNIKGLFNC